MRITNLLNHSYFYAILHHINYIVAKPSKLHPRQHQHTKYFFILLRRTLENINKIKLKEK